MGPAQRNMNQQVTYWAPAGENEYGGSTFGAPILLMGRWEERAEQYRTPSGDDSVSRAVVKVNRTVVIDGYLALGSHTAFATPDFVAGAEQIQQVSIIPDLRNASNEVRAYL